MKICMIGAGYVGLVSGACFADFGWTVTCIDKDGDRVAKLNKGEIPVYESGLDELVERNVAGGRLHFSGCPPKAIGGADLVFLAVGTLMRRGDGYADLPIRGGGGMAPHLDGSTIIAAKSTVPVGTSRDTSARSRCRRLLQFRIPS